MSLTIRPSTPKSSSTVADAGAMMSASAVIAELGLFTNQLSALDQTQAPQVMASLSARLSAWQGVPALQSHIQPLAALASNRAGLLAEGVTVPEILKAIQVTNKSLGAIEGDQGALPSRDLAQKLEAMVGDTEQPQAVAELLDPATDQSQKKPALLKLAAAGKAGIALEFAGNANAWLGDLHALYTSYPELQGFIRNLVETVEEQASSREAQETGLFAQGFDLMKWIEDPASAPGEAYLSSSGVSQPAIFVSQMANYVLSLKHGYNSPDFFNNIKKAYGHSQGVMPAVVASMALGNEEKLAEKSRAVVTYLFWQGTRMEQAYRSHDIDPALVAASVKDEEGVPSPMASITGLTLDQLKGFIKQTNKNLPDAEKLDDSPSLINAYSRINVSGPVTSLLRLRNVIKGYLAREKKRIDKEKISRKLPEFSWAFMPVSAPFHSAKYMAPIPKQLRADMDRLGIRFDAAELNFDVLSTIDGSSLLGSPDLLQALIDMQSIGAVDWRAVTAKLSAENGITHVIDYGPTDGIGKLTGSNIKGKGVAVIFATRAGADGKMAGRAELFSTDTRVIPTAENWADYAPRLVKLPDGTLSIDNKFTRATGRVPSILPGMTPTTVQTPIIIAAANAGFWAELAGGGQVTEQILRTRSEEVLAAIIPGQGMWLNSLVLDPYLWGLQVNSGLLLKIKAEGQPYDGLTWAAGLPPDLGQANKTLGDLTDALVSVNSFKPGSPDLVDGSFEIIDANPDKDFYMQVSAGKQGGHHSWYTLEEILIAKYADIRKRKNIVLGVGGTVDPEMAKEYMTGTWALKHGLPLMPVDFVFQGTAHMVDLEAQTSPEVKRWIAAIPGTGEWVPFNEFKGGIASLRSTVDGVSPIHFADTLASRASAAIDVAAKDEAEFTQQRYELIRLLRETQKPLFGDLKASPYKPLEIWMQERVDRFLRGEQQPGAVMEDIIKRLREEGRELAKDPKAHGVFELDEMTFEQVLQRMIELMAVGEPGDVLKSPYQDGRWVDVSFRKRVFDFAQWVENKLSPNKDKKDAIAFLQDLKQLDDPQSFMEAFLKAIPEAGKTNLGQQDVDYLMMQIFPAGPKYGKPVPFVPEMKHDTARRWFMSDALHQSEDARIPAARTLFIPGPEAVRDSRTVDMPVAEKLQKLVDPTLEALRVQAGDGEIPMVDFIGAVPYKPAKLDSIKGLESSEKTFDGGMVERTIRITDPKSVKTEDWLDAVASQGRGPLGHFLKSPVLVQGKTKVKSYVASILGSRKGLAAVVRLSADGKSQEIVFSETKAGSTRPILTVKQGGFQGKGDVTVTLHHAMADGKGQADLPLAYRYVPSQGFNPFHEVMEGRNQRIKDFYQPIWFRDGAPAAVDGVFRSKPHTVTETEVRAYVAATGEKARAYTQGDKKGLVAPVNMAVAFAETLLQTLMDPDIDGDILKLVHLSNSFEPVSSEPIRVGDVVESEMRILEIENSATGKRIKVEGAVTRDGQPAVKIVSEFFIRGNFSKEDLVSSKKSSTQKTVALGDEASVMVLQSKPWLTLNDGVSLRKDDEVSFDLSSEETALRNGQKKYHTEGRVLRDGVEIGRVSFDHEGKKSKENTVVAYLKRHGVKDQEPVRLDNPYTVYHEKTKAPADMTSYSVASGDRNPIHTDANFARYAGLPDRIVHGMWSSAEALRLVTKGVANGNPKRIKSWAVQFVDTVALGSDVSTTIRHTAMEKGLMVLEVETKDAAGRLVLKGTAKVAQPKTAYVFTGQGSQKQGMGMEAYNRSAAAKDVWDRADAQTRKELGFSILEIVQKNPKEILVGGERLSHPEGVLNLTQFTQVALAVFAMASKAELEEKGVLVEGTPFAGHSAGEYNALSSLGIIPLETVVLAVYQRGLTMQNYVPRDAEGVSPYAMAAVRPDIAKLSKADFLALVSTIASEMKLPLEAVNHNVRGRLYSVTGDKKALARLEKELASMAEARKVDKEEAKKAYRQIPGIDVPFHSTVLRPGVDAFRQKLNSVFPAVIHPELLAGLYIPNLVARPFDLTREFVELVVSKSDSPVLKDVLDHWGDWSTPETRADLARKILIELLAYQFASPVLWEDTQDVLFGQEGMEVERLVEIGPGADLSAMAGMTLSQDPARVQKPAVLHIEGQRADIFFVRASEESSDDTPVEAAQPAAQAAAAPAPAAVEAAPAASSSGGAAAPIADAPLTPLDSLVSYIAYKQKKNPAEINAADNIEKLAGGSAKRNDWLQAIGKEFNVGAIEGAHEKPLTALAEVLAKESKYKGPGEILRAAHEEAIKGLFGGAMSRRDLMAHLQTERLMPEGRIFSFLNFMGAIFQTGTIAKAGSKGDAVKLADQLVDQFGQKIGLSIPKASAMAGGGGGGGKVDSKALKELEAKYFGKNGVFAEMARYLLKVTGTDVYDILAAKDRGDLTPEQELDYEALFKSEFGPKTAKAVTAMFSPAKAAILSGQTTFWSKRDIFEFYQGLKAGRIKPEAARRTMAKLANNATRELLESALYHKSKAEKEGKTSVAETFGQLVAMIEAKLEKPGTYQPVLDEPTAPSVEVTSDGKLIYRETPRYQAEASGETRPQMHRFVDEMRQGRPDKGITSYVDLLSKDVSQPMNRLANPELTGKYLASLDAMVRDGVSFAGKTALVTGAGENSIAIEVVKNLLAGGARVILTTSSYSYKKVQMYKKIYQDHAGKGAELVVVPFNQGSRADADKLLDWVFSPEYEKRGADMVKVKDAWQPDFLVPFGAMPELNTVDTLDEGSDAALRVMLQGVEWLVGGVAKRYKANNIIHKKFNVLLPGSPNPGEGDGFYSEGKRGLEALLNKVKSESEAWGKHASITYARIGWTRGTGLMDANNSVAPDVESRYGARTFSQQEMGFMLTGLLTDAMRAEAEAEPLYVNLHGGFDKVPGLSDVSKEIKKDLEGRVAIAQKLHNEGAEEKKDLEGDPKPELKLSRKANFQFPMAQIPSAERLAELPELQGLVDLTKVVVVAGYNEFGAFGHSDTRWQVEKDGKLSLEGTIEIARLMGLIKYEKGRNYVGWVDAKSGDQVADADIQEKYTKEIMANVGIRYTDPDIQKFDPRKMTIYPEVILKEDHIFEVGSKAEAEQFQTFDPEHTLIREEEGGQWVVIRKAGSAAMLPKSVKLDRYVSAQILKGIDFTAAYGIPKEMVDQIDRLTIWGIVSAVKALFSAGLTQDEIYEHTHVSRVGVTVGGGLGGAQAMHSLYVDEKMGKTTQSDIIQETLINVLGGWLSQGLLGNNGSMANPVGACATAGVSLDVAVRNILTGKDEIVMAGGFDDYSEEGARGFQNMQATSDSTQMEAMGIDPRNHSRPNDRRRKGFMEGQGGGVQLLVRGDVALKMGLPIYAILATTGTYGDGINTSIPAPGLGPLSIASEVPEKSDVTTALLQVEERRRMLDEARKAIATADLPEPVMAALKGAMQAFFGGEVFRAPQFADEVSQLRGALATWGLTADDVIMIVKHDTSTNANDPNEAELHDLIQKHLGRTPGNPLLTWSQKWLTGHLKGGAMTGQINGTIQAMQEGVIPGNGSLDDVDPSHDRFRHPVYTDRTIRVDRRDLKAALVTTLGFGHVGAFAAVVNPDYFFAALTPEEIATYRSIFDRRQAWRNRVEQQVIFGAQPAFTPRTEKPYAGKTTAEKHAEEVRVLLDPKARIKKGEKKYAVAGK